MVSSGLQLKPGIDFETWSAVGDGIVAISNASAWCLGDWLIYGQKAYGQKYKAALARTGLDGQTLRNYAWVARHFPPARRHARMSFQHHAEVVALSEASQDLWLQRAERFGWSRNELRRQLGVARRSRRPAVAETPVVLRIEVATHRERRWREAAAAAEQTLVDWMATTADMAAQASLQDGGLRDILHAVDAAPGWRADAPAKLLRDASEPALT